MIESLHVRDFRCYSRAEVELGKTTTVVHGANGAGKTNLLEALYFGCTARSCRTSNDREMVRFGEQTTRVTIRTAGPDGSHEIAVGLTPGEPKSIKVDGAAMERFSDHPARPLVSVFSPDRLELIKGPPALRRGHLDAVVAGLWPARAANRREYAQALAQRNALLARVRHGGSLAGLDAWDLELARHGIALRDDRAQACAAVAAVFPPIAAELGLEGDAELRYRPRSQAADERELAAELAERRESDLQRGFTQHGPHRDEIVIARDGRELRAFGSQGEQRMALLALLLAEREVLAGERGAPPVMLLDDVMSELDANRRERLITRLGDSGQSLITTTELAHVPGAGKAATIEVADGGIVRRPRAVAA